MYQTSSSSAAASLSNGVCVFCVFCVWPTLLVVVFALLSENGDPFYLSLSLEESKDWILKRGLSEQFEDMCEFEVNGRGGYVIII
jgi:hypothetical protein